MLGEEPSPLETQQGTYVMQTGSGTLFQNKIFFLKKDLVCVLPDVLHTRSIHVFLMNRMNISTRYTYLWHVAWPEHYIYKKKLDSAISKNTSVVCHNPADYLKLQMS